MVSVFRPRHGAAHVLLAVDRSVHPDVIHLPLWHGRFVTRVAQTLEELKDTMCGWRPHLAVVDADSGLADMLAHLHAVVNDDARLPVVALTRIGDLRIKLDAFDWGVDDVVSLPISPEELVARILAVMRRAYSPPISFSPAIQLEDLELDISKHRVRAGGKDVHLTFLEESLLYLLAANRGWPLSRDDILDCLWGIEFAPESNVIDRHIRSLRAKLCDDWRQPRYIRTIPGRGYCFGAAVEL